MFKDVYFTCVMHVKVYVEARGVCCIPLKMELQEVVEFIRALVCNSGSWVHTGASGSCSCLHFPSCFRSARTNDVSYHIWIYTRVTDVNLALGWGAKCLLPLEPPPWPTLYSSFKSSCDYVRSPEKSSRVTATQGPKFNHIC